MRLGLRPRNVTLVHGARGRQKLVELPLDAAGIQRVLGQE
jgi:uncharacterized protein YggU (UPF0235/DUF167 family)